MTGTALLIRPILLLQMGVDFRHQLIGVDTVDLAGLLQGFPSGGRAAQAVHTHFQEIRRRGAVHIQNVADQRILCNRQNEHILSV